MNADNLESLGEQELNEAFAVEVCGWCEVECVSDTPKSKRGTVYFDGKFSHWPLSFCTDANAVLPWLEKWHDADPQKRDMRICRRIVADWAVILRTRESEMCEWKDTHEAFGPFAKAAVCALLRAARSARVKAD